MHNSQKLLLTGLVTFGAAFGAWYMLKPADVTAGPPVSPAAKVKQDQETRRQRQIDMAQDKEVPEGLKKVERGLKDRWDHLGETPLTAANVDKEGEMLYFDKEVRVGRDGDGNRIYAQGAHRAYVMDGPTVREVTRQPITASLKPAKGPASSYMFEALSKGDKKDRNSKPAPAPKTPVSGN